MEPMCAVPCTSATVRHPPPTTVRGNERWTPGGAGWASFYTYARQAKPTGAFARSQASSDTYAYLKNLSRRGCYAIHGTKDDNVPISEMRNLTAALKGYTMDVQTHEEPGAGHWWSSMTTLGGAACVDWPDLFADFQAHRLDPTELEFDFTTPLPSVNAKHSFVTVRSQTSFDADAEVISAKTADNHIQHIYTKLGVTNRAAATRWALDHGVVEPAAD